MRVAFRTFSSAFARRLFLFILLAVAAPALALSLVIFTQASAYLAAQHRIQMHADAKHVGMSLFERLERISVELPRLPVVQSPAGLPGALVVLPDAESAPPWLHPAAPTPDVIAAVASFSQSPETPYLGIYSIPYADAGLALVAVLQTEGGGATIARLRSEFIWTPDQFSRDRSLCVIQGVDHILFCTDPDAQALAASFAEQRSDSNSGQLVWASVHGEMRSVYWDLFLLNLGIEPGWTIVVSEPADYLLAPVRQFGLILLGVSILSILSALMLGIGHLRRVVQPLQTLRSAAHAIGEGERGGQVSINSGDEFEELADVFNTMSRQLDSQFFQLEALAEIDSLILSAVDAGEVLGPVLPRVRRLLNCDFLAVSHEREGEVRLIHAQVGIKGEAERVLAPAVYEAAALTADSVRSTPPEWLSAILELPPCETWHCIRLGGEGHLQGLVIIGGDKGLAPSGSRFALTSQAVGRVSVALSRARWQAALYQQARSDELTGLPNRLALKEALIPVIQRSCDEGLRLAVLFIDLDRFKLINDSIGHAAGDQYLQAIAARIKQCARPGDLVARLGGDEFMVALLELDDSVDPLIVVQDTVDRLLITIPQPVRLGLHELRSTLSIGVSMFPNDGNTLADLMKQADTAMYQAKRSGGNSYRLYASSMQLAAQERMELESDMRQAIETDQFLLFFQPQVSAADSAVEGAEVLLRWNHPVRGLVAPDVFIPIAEESMLITEIDRWVLNAVCRQIRAWLDSGIEPLPVAINISAAQFQRESFVPLVVSTLGRYSLGAERLELEITEGALIQDAERALEVLDELRSLGIKLAIDDFGTGYCSLSYLKTMPISKLKIDRSFVRDITRSSSDAAVVEAILHLASQMNLRSVAEGVESSEEQAWLGARGCDAYQGYLFYRPMNLAAFEQLLVELQATQRPLGPTRLL